MDNDEDNSIRPLRPRQPEPDAGFTHQTFAFRRIGKKFGRYLECGVARVPVCPHCGVAFTATIKVFVDRLIAFGGGTGGFLLKPNGSAPPQLTKDFPEQPEFDETQILPEG